MQVPQKDPLRPKQHSQRTMPRNRWQKRFLDSWPRFERSCCALHGYRLRFRRAIRNIPEKPNESRPVHPLAHFMCFPPSRRIRISSSRFRRIVSAPPCPPWKPPCRHPRCRRFPETGNRLQGHHADQRLVGSGGAVMEQVELIILQYGPCELRWEFAIIRNSIVDILSIKGDNLPRWTKYRPLPREIR